MYTTECSRGDPSQMCAHVCHTLGTRNAAATTAATTAATAAATAAAAARGGMAGAHRVVGRRRRDDVDPMSERARAYHGERADV